MPSQNSMPDNVQKIKRLNKISHALRKKAERRFEQRFEDYSVAIRKDRKLRMRNPEQIFD